MLLQSFLSLPHGPSSVPGWPICRASGSLMARREAAGMRYIGSTAGRAHLWVPRCREAAWERSRLLLPLAVQTSRLSNSLEYLPRTKHENCGMNREAIPSIHRPCSTVDLRSSGSSLRRVAKVWRWPKRWRGSKKIRDQTMRCRICPAGSYKTAQTSRTLACLPIDQRSFSRQSASRARTSPR